MLLNKNTKIIGKNCVLVPYRKEHVWKYHSWMQSEELQKLTASEPLNLEEEYQMQISWTNDENKCTFIVLDKVKYTETDNEVLSMIGDTNLFFANPYDRICVEAQIMIAEEGARGKGCGKESMILMFLYGIEYLEIKQFIVKITENNIISISLFKQFGFIEISHSIIFGEVTLSKIVDENWIEILKKIVGPFKVVEENETDYNDTQ